MKYVGVKTTGELRLHEVGEPLTDEIYMAVEDNKLGAVPIRPYEFAKWDGTKWVKVNNVELATTLDIANVEGELAGKQKTISIVPGAPIILDADSNMDLKISDGSFLDGLPENQPSGYEWIGGKLYKVGAMPDGKIWMCQNLDYKFSYNGSTLPIGVGGNLTTPAAWYYNNDEATYGIDGTYKCGLLYNWYAVKYLNDNRATLIPGWHVASDAEWDALATAVGGTSIGATKLKALDNSVTSNWPSGWGGTDDYGFSALPVGTRSGTDGGSSFDEFGSSVYFWTATEFNSNDAIRTVLNAGTYISKNNYWKQGSCAVRLVKD